MGHTQKTLKPHLLLVADITDIIIYVDITTIINGI